MHSHEWNQNAVPTGTSLGADSLNMDTPQAETSAGIFVYTERQ